MNTETTTDWKAIATALAQRVNFAISHLRATGSGLLANLDEPSEKWQHWRDYMADGIEMYPGVKVDRELMHLNELPRSKRTKARAKIMAEREKVDAGEAATDGNKPATSKEAND